jgi:hypothetical protein
MDKQPNPERHIARIRVTLDDLKVRAARGDRVDTTGLGRDVNMLCEQLAAMPADRARPYSDALSDIVADLDDIEGQLKDSYAELTARLDALAAPEPGTSA